MTLLSHKGGREGVRKKQKGKGPSRLAKIGMLLLRD